MQKLQCRKEMEQICGEFLGPSPEANVLSPPVRTEDGPVSAKPTQRPKTTTAAAVKTTVVFAAGPLGPLVGQKAAKQASIFTENIDR